MSAVGAVGEPSRERPAVHVYRNRADDERTPPDLHFCRHCNGWYGVPHTYCHCQQDHADTHFGRRLNCACRFCRELAGKPIEGAFGFVTDDPFWQPPVRVVAGVLGEPGEADT